MASPSSKSLSYLEEKRNAELQAALYARDRKIYDAWKKSGRGSA